MKIRLLILLAVALVASASAAETDEPRTVPRFAEGTHYTRLPVPVETRDPSKIEVVEVFSYMCPHCYTLERTLAPWLAVQPDDVDFHRIPMAHQGLETLAQAFYTADALNIQSRVHLKIFESIHDYAIDMRRPQYVRRLFVREGGVDEDEFMRTYESFGVMTRVRQADAQTRMYRILGTPSMVVNGRYLVEVSKAGGLHGMLLVVNQLIEMERAAMASAETPAEDS